MDDVPFDGVIRTYRRGSIAGADCASCPFARDGRPPHPPVVAEGPSDDPAWIIVGEGPGSQEVQLSRPFCLVPETMVLMADLTWKPLGEITLGDRVLTVEEEPSHVVTQAATDRRGRRWVVATVTQVVHRRAETIHVRTARGDLIGTPDHRVLARRGRHSKRWLRLDQLTRGKRRRSSISFVAAPWSMRSDRIAGWLAGFFDGEGHVTGSRRKETKRAVVGFAQNLGPTHQRAVAALRELGFDLRSREEQRRNGVVCAREHIRGGVVGSMRFLGTVRPERLVADFVRVVEGVYTHKAMQRVPVLAREAAGVRDVVDISTTAGTFIANGFVVHNCGPSGQLVNKMLSQIRRDRATVWITNTTPCRPPPGASTEEKLAAAQACLPRLQRELAALPPVPILALGAIAARTLLPTRLEGITELADTWHAADVDNTGRIRDVIPTIHPAAILRGGGEVKGAHAAEIGFWNLVYSAGKVESLARGRDIRFDFSGVHTEIENVARANALVAEAYKRALTEHAVAIDLETYVDNEKRHDARQPFVAKIRVLGLATDDWACSVLWRLLSSNSIRLLGLLLRNPSIRKIGQNGIGYDRTVFKALGFEVDDAWDDTMLMHHVSFPGMSHKLQTIVSQFWAVEPWKSEYRASGDSDDEVTLYNAKDVLTTRALTAPLTLWIKRREVENVYELDRQCALIAGQMHLDGIPVDRGVNRELATVLTDVIDRSLAELREAVDAKRSDVWDRLALQQSNTKRKADPDTALERFHVRRAEIEKKASKKGWQFNPNAPLQVVALLQSLGLFLKKRSKSGKQPSTDAEVLEQFKHVPLVQKLIEYREREKIYGTFVLPMFDHLDEKGQTTFGYVQDDGRVHPTWSVHKITGRWGAANPMIQNHSKGDPMFCSLCRTKVLLVGEDAYLHYKPKKGTCQHAGQIVARSAITFAGIPNIRAQVIAPRGRRFVGFDAAQQEARAIALVSGDEWLCDVFAKGKDIHCEFAAVVWPNFWELDDVSRSILREGVKNAEYASFYEGSEETVHKTLIVKLGDPTISLAKTREMIAMMRSKMSGLITWKQRILNAIAKPPHEMRCLILNRLRAFPLAMFSPADVVNWGIQTFSAYMIKSGLVRIMPRLRKYRRCFPVIDVHDAVIFECDEDDVPRLTVDVKECFEQRYTASNGQEIPFPIETKDGASWAEV